jgi:hypothetical protein
MIGRIQEKYYYTQKNNSMNKPKLKLVLLRFLNDMSKNPNVTLSKSSIGHSIGKDSEVEFKNYSQNPDWVEEYQHFFGLQFQWAAMPATGIKATGSIKIMELPIVFGDWEGQAYVSNTKEDSPLRNFKIVDFYENEYASGIIFDKTRDFTFYNIELDGTDPVNLDLDINGYIEMMMYSKGYMIWQRVIEYCLYGGYYDELTEKFKHDMPILFPDWTWEGFIQKFEEVRLHKVK